MSDRLQLLQKLLAQPKPDLQLPPASYDPKTGLDFSTTYPSPDGTMPPEIDPETGLEFGKVYASRDGSLPPDLDPASGLDFNKRYEPAAVTAQVAAPETFVGPPQAPPPVKPDTFVGPPQQQPWHDWTPEQTAKIDGLLSKLDGAKLYQGSGGRLGDAAAFAKLLQDGGIQPEQALTLARYRMSKMDNPGDVPTGPKTPEDTKADVDARNAEFFAAKPEDWPGMMREQKARGYLTNERFYDSLVPQQAVMTASELPMPKLGADATDDQKLSDAQLQLLYQLSGNARK